MGRIFIVRHGQTDLNKRKIMQGRIDSLLNEEGKRQAEETAALFQEKGVEFARVYSSPLKRAMATAKIIAGEDRELLLDEKLLEMDYGPYDGVSLENPPEELVWFFKDFVHHNPPEGMEKLSHVVERAGEFLRSIQDEIGDQDVLISTHAITMKGMLEYLNPKRNGEYWDKYIGNCSVYWSEWRDGVFSLPEELI